MATKVERTQTIESYEKALRDAQGIYLTDFSRITVEKMTKLRSDFRSKGVKYVVVKNSLARRALEKCNGGRKDLIPHFKGHIGAAIATSDSLAPSKVIKQFQKDNPDLLGVRIAYVDGAYFSGADIVKLADMPSRQQLLSMLLSTLKAPTANLAGALGGIMGKLVGTLESVKDQKEKQAPAA